MKRLFAYAAPYAGSALLLKASGFALSLTMAASLSVDAYGSWGLAYALQTAVVTFGAVGILEAVVGMLPHHGTLEGRAVLFSMANRTFGITVAASSAMTALVGIYLAAAGAVGPVTVAGALLSGGLLAYATLQAQLIRLEERHFASLGYQFVVPMAAVLGSAALVFLWPSVDAFFVGAAGGTLLAMGILYVLGVVVPRGDRGHVWQIVRRLVPYAGVAFFGWQSGYGNNIAVNVLFGTEEVARLTFALTVGAVIQLAATSMNQVWSPHFYRITHIAPFEEVEQKNRSFFLLQSVLLGAAAAAALLALSPVLGQLGGNLRAYDAMTVEVFWVLLGYLALIPWWYCQNYFLAYDRGKDVLRIVGFTGIVGIALWLALMSVLGPLGIYVGFFTQMALRSLGSVYVARKVWPLRIGWANVVVGPLLAGAAFAIVWL